jgi:hypothetical protein
MPDEINDLIDAAIKELSDDNIHSGVGSLIELAHKFAAAGLGIESFLNTRKYIIDEAIRNTDAFFITEKIKLAEREAQNDRLFTDQARGTTRKEAGTPESTGLH